MRSILWGVVLALVLATIGYGQYEPEIIFEAEGDISNQQLGHSTLVPVGDLDGDGYDDILVNAWTGGFYSREWRIYYGSEDGTERYTSFARMDSVSRSHVVEYDGFFDDMNGDGYLDIFAAFIRDNSSSYSFMRALYYGWPNFDTIPDWVSPWQIQAYGNGDVVGDYDGDGYADYVTREANAGRFWFHRGGPEPESLPLWSFGRSASGYGTYNGGFGDVNGDGYDDFLRYSSNAAYPDSNAVDLFLGGPEADSLPDVTLWWPYYIGHRWVIVPDLNGDGCDEIYGTMSCLGEDWSCLRFGGNPPDFEGDLVLWPGAGPAYEWCASVGDINLDGYNDLAISSTAGGLWGLGGLAIYLGGALDGWTSGY